MQGCDFHQGAVDTTERAHGEAAWLDAVLMNSPKLFGEVVNALAVSPVCCPRAGYARSLMLAALRWRFRGEG
jgi:hypothetical protein